MSDLTQQLEALDRAVPDAPEFVGSIMRRLPGFMPPAKRMYPSGLRIRHVAIGAVAASILIAAGVLLVTLMADSPQRAFAEVVHRAEQYDSVRYTVCGDGITDHRTFASGGLRRSDLTSTDTPECVVIRNPKTLPDLDLTLYPKARLAVFTPVDHDREKLAADNPVDALKDLATAGVKAGPDETYKGKRVTVYSSAKPQRIDSSQNMIRRVLIDKATGLPVRIEITYEIVGQGADRAVYDDFEWNPRIDADAFSTKPPNGYEVQYNLMKPLVRGLIAYSTRFDGRLPDAVNDTALNAWKRRRNPDHGDAMGVGQMYDADWGFAVPALAARYKLDFRYYGKGKTFDAKGPRKVIAAIEIAPHSPKYDVLMSDQSRARWDRSQLP